MKILQKKYFIFLLLIPLAAYFFFGWQHLTKFETADEHYWIYSKTVQNNYWNRNDGRIHQYWDALRTGNWVMTRINDKPGITLAYVSGAGSWLKTDLDKRIFNGTAPIMSKMEKAEKINLYFRLPILIFNGLFSIALYFLLRKILGSDWMALLSITFILLSPIILGISQIVNPDALLWEFSFAAILSFLIFLRDSSGKYAAWAGIFLGLSLLTKYSSVILIPFFLAVMLAYMFENMQSWKKEDIFKKIKFYSLSYFLVIAGGLLIYAVILPDNIIEFRHFMKGSIGFKGMQAFFTFIFAIDLALFLDAKFLKSQLIVRVAELVAPLQEYLKTAFLAVLPFIFLVIIFNTAFGKDWLDLFKVSFDDSSRTVFKKIPYGEIFLMQFLPFVFSLTPLVIFGTLGAWLKNAFKDSRSQWVIFVFSFFLLVFISAAIQQKLLLTIRYSIILYPMIMTIASVGIYQIFSLDKKNLKFKAILYSAVFLISLSSLYASKPFYFNYMNDLLPKKYLITDAWGYGGYEAAEQLNRLPNAESLRVWSDYNGFCLFFKGNCLSNALTMKNIRKEKPELPHFDYFISSRRGKILARSLWESLPVEYDSQPIWRLILNDRPENSLTIYENEIYKKEN